MRMWEQPKLTAVMVIAALGMVAVGAAGCGGSEEKTGAGEATEAPTATAAAPVETATAAAPVETGAVTGEAELLKEAGEDVARFRADPTWEDSAPPPAPSPKAGLKIGAVTCLWAVPACKRSADGLKEAIEAIGWKPMVLDGTAEQRNQRIAIQTFLNENVDGFIVESIDPNGVADLLEEAAQRGIPFLAHNGPNVGSFGGVDGIVGFPTYEDGKKLAAWVANDSGGKARILMFSSTDNPLLQEWDRGFRDYLERFPGIEFIGDVIYVPFKDLGPPLEAQAQSVFQAHPPGTVDYVYAPFGGFAVFLDNAAQAVGRDDLKIVSFDGDLQTLEFIRQGKNQVVNQAAVWVWCSWAAVDELNRAINGAPWGGGRCASTLLDKTNLPPPGEWWEPQLDYKAEYRKLWGVD